MRRLAPIFGLALVIFAIIAPTAASARSLQLITDGGTLFVCAHPNALPYASRYGDVPGLQIEIAEAIAKQLGVTLTRNWVFSSYQFRRAGCDIVLDAIGDKGALADVGLRSSRPYYRSGVTLAVRKDSPTSRLSDLSKDTKVGVQVGSIAAMRFSKAGIGISPFVFEDEMLDALQNKELDAAAVTPGAIGWFNLKHPDAQLRQVPVFEGDADLNWNVAVGMIGPDDKLRERIDAAVEALLADGTLSRLYARYGMAFRPPE
jgi:polar amino acid transport system substrate-binding protein